MLLQAGAQAGSSQKGGQRQSALKGTPPPSKKRKESEQQGDGDEDDEVRLQHPTSSVFPAFPTAL